MKAYLINLGKRKDRLDYISAEARDRGFSFVRIPAVDGSDPVFQAQWAELPKSILGAKIGPGAVACLESHRKAWALFLEGDDPHAMVLEDDLVFGQRFDRFLEDGWVPEDADVVRLECYPHLATKFDLRRRATVHGRRIHRVRSSRFGPGAYTISRDAAQRLVTATDTLKDHVDALMFHQNSPFFGALRVYQVMPAPAIQAAELPLEQRPAWAVSSLASERERLSSGSGNIVANSQAILRRFFLPLAWKTKALMNGMLHAKVSFR